MGKKVEDDGNQIRRQIPPGYVAGFFFLPKFQEAAAVLR